MMLDGVVFQDPSPLQMDAVDLLTFRASPGSRLAGVTASLSFRRVAVIARKRERGKGMDEGLSGSGLLRALCAENGCDITTGELAEREGMNRMMVESPDMIPLGKKERVQRRATALEGKDDLRREFLRLSTCVVMQERENTTTLFISLEIGGYKKLRRFYFFSYLAQEVIYF